MVITSLPLIESVEQTRFTRRTWTRFTREAGYLLIGVLAVAYLAAVAWLFVIERQDADTCTARGWHQATNPISHQLHCVPPVNDWPAG